MNEESRKLAAMLLKHEGLRLKPYVCPAGKLTIGVGRNIEDMGISEEEAIYMLENDIHRVRIECSKAFTWFQKLSPVRQDVVISMVFNLGMPKFLEFRAMIAAIQKGEYDRAASEMLNSKWAAQTGRRAVELAQMMRSGEYA